MAPLPRRRSRSSRRARTPLRRALRLLRWPLAVLALAVVVSGVVLGVQALLVARDLQRADDRLGALQAAASQPEQLSRLPGLLAEAQGLTARAADRTDGPLWDAWRRAPLLGDTVTTTAGTAREVDRLTTTVLPPVLAGVQALPGLRDAGGRVDLALLAAQAPVLRTALDEARATRGRLEALPEPAVREVVDGRQELVDRLRAFETQLAGLSAAADAGPGLLGAAGPRRYLLLVQNNAEARASGGIVGAYGVVAVADGRLSLEDVGPGNELLPTPGPAVDLGPEYANRYARLGALQDWRELTATPDFPSAAQVALALWRETRGEQLDGVLSVDPVALSDVLAATGPQPVADGRTVSAEDAVALLLVDAYARYPDQERRDAVLTSTAESAFRAVAAGAGAPLALAERLGHAAATGHLKLYSTSPAEQEALRRTSLAGALPADRGPYLSVVTQDAGASKLSVYLDRTVTVTGGLSAELQDYGDGRGPQRQHVAEVAVTLTSTAPASGLPDYVVLREDLPGGAAPVRGRMNHAVSVYLGRGGQLDGATRDGVPLPMSSETEQGMAVFTTAVELDPGQSTTLLLRVRQPAPEDGLVYAQQPLVRDDALVVRPD